MSLDYYGKVYSNVALLDWGSNCKLDYILKHSKFVYTVCRRINPFFMKAFNNNNI